jgi:hypothetical protein
MAAHQHETLIRAYIDEVFNGHRVDALDKYWDDDLTSHWLGMETIHGLPAWRSAMEGFFAAFPDAAYTLDDMFFAGAEASGVATGRQPSRAHGKGSPRPAAP